MNILGWSLFAANVALAVLNLICIVVAGSALNAAAVVVNLLVAGLIARSLS